MIITTSLLPKTLFYTVRHRNKVLLDADIIPIYTILSFWTCKRRLNKSQIIKIQFKNKNMAFTHTHFLAASYIIYYN